MQTRSNDTSANAGTRAFTVIRSGRELTIHTPHSDSQAHMFCLQAVGNDFAQSLAHKYRMHIQRGWKFSAKQLAWMHVVGFENSPAGVAERERQRAERERARLADADVVNVAGIMRLFRSAKEHGLKKPGINIAADPDNVLRLRLATRGSRAGHIHIARPGWDNAWYGTIHPDGTLDLRKSAPEWARTLVLEFAADPVTVAARYGKLTNRCSFCSRELTDARSVAVGYGPVCADHFGLPWGTEKADGAMVEKFCEPESARDRNLRNAGLAG